MKIQLQILACKNSSRLQVEKIWQFIYHFLCTSRQICGVVFLCTQDKSLAQWFSEISLPTWVWSQQNHTDRVIMKTLHSQCQPLDYFVLHWASKLIDISVLFCCLSFDFLWAKLASCNLVLTESQILTWPSNFLNFGAFVVGPGPEGPDFV